MRARAPSSSDDPLPVYNGKTFSPSPSLGGSDKG